VRNTLDINKLDRIAIVGVGLLGGSIGLALQASGFRGVRVGIGRRASSLARALACEAVDEVTLDPAAGVADVQLVVLCTPIGRFESLLRQIAPGLAPGAYVTDVASTKAEVVRLSQQILSRSVRFVGSHPMAGSEKTGVEFARADLFEDALCMVTPTPATPAATVRNVRRVWEVLGCQTQTLSPQRHDKLLARVSHLPHAVATALVRLAQGEQAIDLAGPGFADTTRIASGDPGLWTDIFRTNSKAMIQAVDAFIAELSRFRGHLDSGNDKAVQDWLTHTKTARDQWIDRRYKKKGQPRA